MSDAVVVVRMACGCLVVLGSTDEAPMCRPHNEHRVQQVKAPAPRFRGVGCDLQGALVVKHA